MIDFVIEASKGIMRLKETVYYSSEYLDRAEFMYVIALTVIIGVVTILSVIVALISYRQNKTSDEKTVAAINELNAQVAASKADIANTKESLTSQMAESIQILRAEYAKEAHEYGEKLESLLEDVAKLKMEAVGIITKLQDDPEGYFNTEIGNVLREARQHRYELMVLQYFTYQQLALHTSENNQQYLYTDAVIGVTTKALQDYKAWGYTDADFHSRTFSPDAMLTGTVTTADGFVTKCTPFLEDNPSHIKRLIKRLGDLRAVSVSIFDDSPIIVDLEDVIIELAILDSQSPTE